MSDPNNRAIVLFSGGQDSTTCLAWALDKFDYVDTVGFDYRQRHSVELQGRALIRARISALDPVWASKLGPDHMVDLQSLHALSDTALTREAEIAFDKDGLPNTFVPGRNLLFFTYAAAIAYRRDLDHLVGGMCETDFSGYPDCRDATLRALQTALALGMNRRFAFHTPLMWLDKAATWQLAADLGGAELLEIVRKDTHTCYLGERGTEHEWGFGCGECPACQLRRDGFHAYSTARKAA